MQRGKPNQKIHSRIQVADNRNDAERTPGVLWNYHLKRMNVPDKYKEVKAEITAIYRENKGQCGYRHITTELHNYGFSINHKTVQRLMKEMGVVCYVRMKKYRSYKGKVGKSVPIFWIGTSEPRNRIRSGLPMWRSSVYLERNSISHLFLICTAAIWLDILSLTDLFWAW